MGNEHPSVADRFIGVMAEVARMSEKMPDGAEERFAVWKMQEAATTAILEGLFAAMRCVDSARMIRQAADELRKGAK